MNLDFYFVSVASIINRYVSIMAEDWLSINISLFLENQLFSSHPAIE